MKEIFTLNALPLLILWRFLALSTIIIAVIWLYSVIRIQLSKMMKNNLRLTIKYAVLESILLVLLLMGVYMVLFFYHNGWQRFVWDSWAWSWTNTYFMLLPEIVVFISLNVIYLFRLKNLKKITKS